jgi:serine/threonine protein kinase
MPEDLAASRVGQTIGKKWKLERLLGEGGMAAVYAGVDPDTGERAAIKVLHPEMTRRKDVRERFLREAYVANRIAHPGAVRVLSHGHDNETFLVMELLEGEPLSARAQRLSDFTVRELLGYANEILDVLAAAHDKGVIHRDIKPDNVFVTNERHAKILDFGIARVLDDVPQAFKTRTGLALGTVPYMAPEQALGRRGEVDGRSDLFALGALLFRILSGRRIHDEKSEAELLVAMATRSAPSLADVAPNVPAHVSAVVDIALAFSREARYPDARTMQADVQALLSGHRPPYATANSSRREAKTRVDQLIPATAMGGDSPTGGTMVSQGHSGQMQADSISAPTRVVVPPPASQKVTVPFPAVEAPYSQRPGSQAIAMPMVDDLDALIMAPLPAAPPSALGATVPAGTAPPPMHDSAPPPAMPTAPAQFARSVLPEKKKSGGVWFFILAIFAVGALIAFVGAALALLVTQNDEAATAAPSTSTAPSAIPSAVPIPLDPTSSPAPEESASASATVGTVPKAPVTTGKVKPATPAATSASKTIPQPSRPSANVTPPASAPATTPPTSPTPTTTPPGPPGKGKDKDKDKAKGKGHN